MMVTKKRAIALGALVAGSVVVLAGCAGNAGGSASEAPEEASTLTVWVDQERIDALKGAAEAYTEETGVEVELVAKDNSTIKDDFIQQVPTGRGPDITMGAHD